MNIDTKTEFRKLLENQITELEIKRNIALTNAQHEDVQKLEELIFDKEKYLFLSALEKFKEGTMELAEAWICCNEILDNLTMHNSYPFDQDFQSMQMHILKWANQLQNNINGYKGEE
jgi:DNA-directed RNA polymerase beta' subunit